MNKGKLGEYLDVTRGTTLPGSNYAEQGDLVRLTLGNFYEEGGFKHNTSKANIYYVGKVKNEYILQEGDIITPLTEQSRGLLGATARIPESNKYIQSQDIGLVKCKPGKLAESFCYYLLSSSMVRRQLSAGAQQTKIRHTSPDKIKDVVVIIPGYDKQVKIGTLLDFLTKKIELNNKINEKLEKVAETLYNYWFVQFDFPDKNKRPYKSSGGKMVYNEVLKREIPEGWSVSDFYSNPLTTVIQPGIEAFDGDKVYLPTASVQGDKIVDYSHEITFQDRGSRANMQPTHNSIWFAKMKNSKKILLVGSYATEYLNKFTFSTGFCGLFCQEIALEYMWNTINSSYFESRKDILAHGATQEAIGNDDLKSIPLLIPSKPLLELYHQRTNQLYRQKYVNEIENRQLILLRDFLLPMLMNGQVSV